MKTFRLIVLMTLILSSTGYPQDEKISLCARVVLEATQCTNTTTAAQIRALCPDWCNNREEQLTHVFTRRGASIKLIGLYENNQYCLVSGDGQRPQAPVATPDPDPEEQIRFYCCSERDLELLEELSKPFRQGMDDDSFRETLASILNQLDTSALEQELTSRANNLRLALADLKEWVPLGKFKAVPRSRQWDLANAALTAYWQLRDAQVLQQVKMTFL